MVYYPERNYDLPDVDLLSFLFDSPLSWAKEDTLLHVEAAIPSNALNKIQTRSYAKRIAYALRNRYGIGSRGPGKDVVVVVSTGQVLLPCMFYGVIAADGVFSAASASFTAPELARQVKQGEAKLLVCSGDVEEVAKEAAAMCGLSLDRVLVLESNAGKRSLRNLHAGAKCLLEATDGKELDWRRITDRKELENSVICLLYSSGTTGIPKGVKISHANIVAEGLLPQLLYREYFARRLASGQPAFEYRTLGHLPAAHIAGCQGYFINPTIAGGTVYWMPKFDFPKFLEYNQKFRITSFFTVPPIYLLIAKSPLVTDQFATLEQAISGAAPMGPELTALAEKKLGCNISQTWGLSETTGSATIMQFDKHDSTGSVSPLMPNTMMRIVDDDDRDVPEGQPGEFVVKGPIVCRGYFANEKATRESFTADGWFRTGDVGLRKNDMFYIVDRKKELIKYKGLQVAPAELEALLLSHDLINDAAVIGVPDPDGSGNELPRAYVVADKSKISEQQITEFVRKNLAQHKQLRGGVVWLDAIPKSPSGKILRRELRELAKRDKNTGLSQAKL